MQVFITGAPIVSCYLYNWNNILECDRVLYDTYRLKDIKKKYIYFYSCTQKSAWKIGKNPLFNNIILVIKHYGCTWTKIYVFKILIPKRSSSLYCRISGLPPRLANLEENVGVKLHLINYVSFFFEFNMVLIQIDYE